jgi:hypothetical protein
MIPKPAEADFTGKPYDGGVDVFFEPTKSEYNFHLLADPIEIAKTADTAKYGHHRDGRPASSQMIHPH